MKTKTKVDGELPLPYPARNHQYHSYGVRFWHNNRWLYWGSIFSARKGWVDQWTRQEHRCWTTTGLLSAMLLAQDLALKEKEVVEVVQFEEPKVLWVAYHKHRQLILSPPLSKAVKSKDKRPKK